MKSQHTGQSRKRKGYAIIATVLSASLLFPMVGLAIDVGILYVVRAQLWLAADSASMAGSRALGSATDQATQTANAQAAATTYFDANWPKNFWKSGTPNGPNVKVVPGTNIRSVVTTASVSVPLYFLRILHQDAATVAVTATATRQDALIMMVLDRSISMNYKMAGGQTACHEMVAAATAFVSNFTEGRDLIGLVTFSAGVFSYPPTTFFNTKDKNGNTIPSLINSIACDGNTATASGLNAGYTQMQNAYKAGLSAGRANIIFLVTDGRPNGLEADYIAEAQGPCLTNNFSLHGTIAQWSGGPNASGTTAGILNPTDNAPKGGDVTISASSCQFTGDARNVRNDLTGMPQQDIFGNYTTSNAGAGYTSYTSQNPHAPWSSQDPILSGSGSTQGVQSPRYIIMASANAADFQANVIRKDTTLRPQIYTLAVMGTAASDPPDPLFLQKMANYGLDPNDATASKFAKAQVNQTKGYYVPAPDPTQIKAAFQQVAAQIGMRLAQ